jgi:hypothetical protein
VLTLWGWRCSRVQKAVALGGGSVVEENVAKAARPEVKLQLFDEDGAKSAKLKAQKAKDAAKTEEAKAASIAAMTEVRTCCSIGLKTINLQ